MSKVEPKRNMYVGHRYVPKIFGEWDKRNSYEGLSIVTHQGNSYTSKQYVPVGVDIKNEKYWVVTGNYNVQVEHYRQEVVRMGVYIDQEINKIRESKDRMVYDIMDYGAIPDRTTDISPVIEELIRYIPDYATIYIPPTEQGFLWKSEDEQLLLMKKPFSIQGRNSKIIGSPNYSGEADFIRISPEKSWYPGLISINGLHVTSGGGSRLKNGITFDIKNHGVMGLDVSSNALMNLDGFSIELKNPTNNDGFYLNKIEDNWANSGMYFERLGDSNLVNHNNLFGKFVGVEASAVPGALQNIMEYNNVTSDGGSFKINSGGQIKVRNNQCEQVNPYNGNVGSMVYVEDSLLSEVYGNNLNGMNNVDRLIRTKGTTGLILDNNYLQRSKSFYSVWIDENSTKTKIGKGNEFLTTTGSLVFPRVLDEGKGTEVEPFNNGWTPIFGEWTYKSPTRIIVSAIDQLSAGDKITFTQGGTKKYFYFVRAHSLTEIEVTGGSDFQVTDQTITEISFSKEENPKGFPDWFSYNPTYTGFETPPESKARFNLKGKMCNVNVQMTKSGISNDTFIQVSLPVTADSEYAYYGYGYVPGDTANKIEFVSVRTQPLNGNHVYITKAPAGFSEEGSKSANFTIGYEIN